jgi:hypothetical protein
VKLSKIGIVWLLFLAGCAGAATTAGIITHEWNIVFLYYGIIAATLVMRWACTYQIELSKAFQFFRLGFQYYHVPAEDRADWVLDRLHLRYSHHFPAQR